MTNKPLYEKIGNDIKELIACKKIKAGEKIPSVNDIRGKYDVSHVTALRVLKELSNENYIEFVSGKGYFAKKYNEKANLKKLHGTIAFFMRPFRQSTLHDNYFNDINQAIQQECMKKGFDIFYPQCNMPLDDHEPSSKALDLIEESMLEHALKADGFFVDERIPDSNLQAVLKKTAIPMIIINRRSNLPVDSITPDNVDGAKRGAELCIKMNYDNFILCRNLLASEHTEKRLNSFIKTLKENGIDDENIFEVNYNIDPYENTFKEVQKKLDKKLKNLIFSPTDSLARDLADKFTYQGVQLGKDIGVLGFEGMGYATFKKPHISTVNIQSEKLGKKAAEVLIGRIKGENIKKTASYTVQSTFNIGETI